MQRALSVARSLSRICKEKKKFSNHQRLGLNIKQRSQFNYEPGQCDERRGTISLFKLN